jgi:hypothetical protein
VDPFGNFDGLFGFLDTAPTSATQVRFLQYYVDLFDDLLRAYYEFRWKGVELVCACCPPEGLFPRHLMLGLLHPEKSGQPSQYREAFRPSPAAGCCAADAKTVLQLFSRLVEMVARFTDMPSLPKPSDKARIDPQIRVTPSTLGDGPLAKKAIPYYYGQNGTPPLYQLWDRKKTLRNRANQNPSYRYDEYNPQAPVFVSDPLRYDLEPYNFLRIEGHLAKDYQRVLSTLLLVKSQYRLPIDFVALRTGAYDDTQPVDLSQQSARFQDLEALYDSLREELLSSLAEGTTDLYDVLIPDNKLPGGTPKLPLLQKYAPSYRYAAGSVGAVYEEHLAFFQAIPYIDIDQTLISDSKFAGQVLKVYCTLFVGVTDLPPDKEPHVVSIFYFSKLSDTLPETLDALGYADFENRYRDLLALVRFFRNDVVANIPPDLKIFAPQAELIDQFDQVLFNCKLDSVKAVHDEYFRRVGELRKRQFLSNFLQQHPGIQHKAGVPLGGTFLLVYHGEPTPSLSINDNIVVNATAFSDVFGAREAIDIKKDLESAPMKSAAGTKDGTADVAIRTAQVSEAIKNAGINKLALTDAVNRISSNQFLNQDADIKLILGSLTGKIPIGPKKATGPDDPASRIIATTVDDLDNGIVIADFFLPYKISSDCPGIEFVLPKLSPSFTVKAGCTDADANASVKVQVKGGVAPYDIAIDEGGYDALGAALVLQSGTHTLRVRDAEGLESSPQTIVIPGTIAISIPNFNCEENKYTATFTIAGGIPPYTVNGKAAPENTFTTDPVASGTAVSIEVLDNVKCSFKTSLTHECPRLCDLPCNGISVRRGYRFWIPEPDEAHQYKNFRIDTIKFSVEAAKGKSVDLTSEVEPMLTARPADLNAKFNKVVGKWLDLINKSIAVEPGLNHRGKVAWLTLDYESMGPGRLGTLWIEYFECLRFDIQILSTAQFANGARVEGLKLRYSPEGTKIGGVQDSEISVPPFDGERSDKCNPDKPIEQLCSAPPLKLIIAKTAQRGTKLTLGVKPEPDSPDLQFLWEVQEAKPPMANGRKFNTTFPNAATHSVTVTAFTKEGCTVTETIEVPIG